MATGSDSSGVRIPPPLIYIAGFALGIGLEAAFPISGLPSALALLAGLAGGAIWLVLDGAAMLRFHRARTSMVPVKPTTALVVSGPYRLTRNPMYVGMAFLYAGLALALGMIWSLALLPVVLLIVDRQVIAREERYLEAKFGDEYREYKKRVRRWL
ncbi:MAG: methyltransferase family protein [Solirubrobacterales bacterium]